MNRNIFFAVSLLSAATFAAAPSAFAEPQYTAGDIVEHFADADLGKTRRICFGTVSECDENEPAAAQPKPFDLRITFDLNSADLTPQAREDLDQFATAIQRLDGQRFYVDGHTDARGSEPYNYNLSEARAQAVVAYLNSQGIESERLTARGFGETRLLSNDGLADINRRVETNIVPAP